MRLRVVSFKQDHEIGPWGVVDDDTNTVVRWGFETNADAWRWLERYTGQPVSISESVRSHY
jgi:hypothetical protein